MNKIIFLAGVLFLGNVNGMDGMDSCSSAVSCPQENRHSDIEKCMIVCDALSEANSELHNKFESSEKSRDKVFYHEEIVYTETCLGSVSYYGSDGVRPWCGRIVRCLKYASTEKREKAIQALKDMGYENCERLPGRTLSFFYPPSLRQCLWQDD